MKNQPVAVGKVVSLSVNGTPITSCMFNLEGPENDTHSGFTRSLSGHDGVYLRTSDRKKGDQVFNWRTWTGLSQEEIREVESQLGLDVPQGCLLENLVVSGIPGFSQLAPTSRLVFSREGSDVPRPILVVWEENGPCKTVGERLEHHHAQPGLKTDFIAAALHRRGVMGFVLAA